MLNIKKWHEGIDKIAVPKFSCQGRTYAFTCIVHRELTEVLESLETFAAVNGQGNHGTMYIDCQFQSSFHCSQLLPIDDLCHSDLVTELFQCFGHMYSSLLISYVLDDHQFIM